MSTIKASEVRVGDRIASRGLELTVTRIDTGFMGMDLLAFVEDSDVQWLKLPMPPGADVDVVQA